MNRIRNWIQTDRRFDVIKTGLTLVIIANLINSIEVLFRTSFDKLSFISISICILGLFNVKGRARKSKLKKTWLMMTAGSLLSLYLDWPNSSNHSFLFFYTNLSVFISTCFSDDLRDKILMNNLRYLIGTSMLFAVIQKLSTPEFISGDFFYYLFYVDTRFSTLAELFFLQDHAHQAYSFFLSFLNEFAEANRLGAAEFTLDFPVNHLLSGISKALAFFIIGLEMILAVAFLAPQKTWLSKHRDIVLAVFCLGTYTVSLEIIFGMLLMTAGFIQSRRDSKWTQQLYLAVALILAGAYSLRLFQIAAAVEGS
jgi:hypothetical protein